MTYRKEVIQMAKLVLLLLLVGCTAKKPALQRNQAHLAIPVSCIDKVVAGTKITRCDQLPGDGTEALCSGVIVKFHCTEVTTK